MSKGAQPRPPGGEPSYLLALALLAGCAPPAEDLDAWTQQQRAAFKPSLPALPEPGRPEPAEYAGARHGDPFDPQRVTPPEARRQEAAGAQVTPASAAATTRGALLARPLEDMTLVGTLRSGASAQALIRIDGQVLAVAPGDALGPNRGRVARIDDRRVEVRETVRGPAGAWTERTTELPLQGAPR